jgi:hypothetical protein
MPFDSLELGIFYVFLLEPIEGYGMRVEARNLCIVEVHQLDQERGFGPAYAWCPLHDSISVLKPVFVAGLSKPIRMIKIPVSELGNVIGSVIVQTSPALDDQPA